VTATVAAARARLRRRAGRFPILLYHRIAETAPDPALAPYAVRPADFRRQMALLRRMGFTTVRPEDVLAARRGERTLPTRAVWVTFDDGYADFEDVAVPILRANGQTATVFVASALVGRNATWDAPGHRLLGWDALRRVVAAGCSVQAHGAHHGRLTLLSDADLASEIAESRDALTTGLGVAPIVFAYPFGDHDARVRRAVAAAGYGLAVTTDAGLSGDDPLHALRRVYVVRDDGLLDFVARLAHGGRAPESVRRLSRAARRPAG
jgi:peptidoglycan/xylan/chitin deacetylase (PgdA/CDA1 family)